MSDGGVAEAYVALEAGALPRPSPSGEEESMWDCIALDPGGTTGWCLIGVYEVAMYSPEYRILENVARWSCGEFTGSISRQVDALIDLVGAWETAEVVAEDFILRTSNPGREVLDPVRITEPLKWWLESGGRRAWDTDEEEDWAPRVLHLQQPAMAMTTITDERLKAMGLYSLTAGKPHARDALRHALTFARRRKAELERAGQLMTGMTREEKTGETRGLGR